MLLESNAPDRLSFSRRDVALIASTCCARAVEQQSGGDWRVGGTRAALDVRDADGRWYWRHISPSFRRENQRGDGGFPSIVGDPTVPDLSPTVHPHEVSFPADAGAVSHVAGGERDGDAVRGNYVPHSSAAGRRLRGGVWRWCLCRFRH